MTLEVTIFLKFILLDIGCPLTHHPTLPHRPPLIVPRQSSVPSWSGSQGRATAHLQTYQIKPESALLSHSQDCRHQFIMTSSNGWEALVFLAQYGLYILSLVICTVKKILDHGPTRTCLPLSIRLYLVFRPVDSHPVLNGKKSSYLRKFENNTQYIVFSDFHFGIRILKITKKSGSIWILILLYLDFVHGNNPDVSGQESRQNRRFIQRSSDFFYSVSSIHSLICVLISFQLFQLSSNNLCIN